MYKMSNRSKVGRVMLLPAFVIVWLLWVIFSGFAVCFSWLEHHQEKIMNKFNKIIDRWFPLG